MKPLQSPQNHHVIFPVIEGASDGVEQEIIQIFLQRYRDIDFMRIEGKILSSIEKTALLTGNSEGVITKILVENGLRASRRSLPQEFLDYSDNQTLRQGARRPITLSKALEDLKTFWIKQGESAFSFLDATSHDRAMPSFLTV